MQARLAMDRPSVRASSLARRALRALRRSGPLGFARLSLYNLVLLLRGDFARHRYIYDTSWDRTHGVFTSGFDEVDELTAPEHEKPGAYGYEPTPPEGFAYLLGQLGPEGWEGYTFIDIGSGKGRALLLAAFAGFRKVIGIELAEELHAVACSNIAAVRERVPSAEIISVRADARTFAPPPDPTVCFLNNPFGPEVLDPVLDNLEASLAARPRPFKIIYYHSNHADRVDRRQVWRRLAAGAWPDESHHFAVYEWTGSA